MNESTIEEGKNLAILSYITILGTVISFFLNNDKKNPFTAFHVRQALGLNLSYLLVAKVVSSLDNWFASLGFWVFFAVLFIYGVYSAFTGKMQEVPFLGSYFQKWFAKLGSS